MYLNDPRQRSAQLQSLDEKFDAYVEKTLQDWQAPGVIVSVVKDGEHIFAKGYGTRRYGQDLPPDGNTLFQIASHSKPITAAAIAILVDEGILGWDDPVRKHIPEFQFSDTYTTENAALRDLLVHRAGLPFFLDGTSVQTFVKPDYSFDDLLDDLKTSKPIAGFRERHSYTNVGYAIAGEVITRVSGMSWEDFVTRRIFEPLGMTSSYTTVARLREALGDPHEIDNIFLSIDKDEEAIISVEWTGFNSIHGSGGGNITTANDIAKWLLMHLQDGEYNGECLISTESVREMRKPQMVVSPLLWGDGQLDWAELHNPFGHFLTYGLGWFSYDYQGRKIDEHTGLAVNRSSIAVVPEEKLGIAVCTNACFSTPDVWRDMRMTGALKMKAFDYFFGAPETDWSAIFWDIHEKEIAEHSV